MEGGESSALSSLASALSLKQSYHLNFDHAEYQRYQLNYM